MSTPNKAAQELGRIGGKSKSPRKVAASRANGAKGGRPRHPDAIKLPNGIIQEIKLGQFGWERADGSAGIATSFRAAEDALNRKDQSK